MTGTPATVSVRWRRDEAQLNEVFDRRSARLAYHKKTAGGGLALAFEENTMKTLVTGTLLAVAMASSPVLAQTTTAPATSTPPAATTAAPAMDAAVEAKFKTADKNNSGALDGAEVDLYKANITKIDTNKDGKVSRDEFAAATKAGDIK